MNIETKIGKEVLKQNGNAIVLRLPDAWLAQHGLSIGSPLYSVLTIDNEIRIHLQPTQWSRSAKIRRFTKGIAGYLTLNAAQARTLGLRVGAEVVLSVQGDPLQDVLILRRAKR